MTLEANAQPVNPASHKTRMHLILVCAGSALTMLAAVLNLRSAQPALLVDICGLTLLATGVMLLARDPVARWVPWICAGALVGASIIGVLFVAPFVLGAAGLFLLTGVLDNPTRRPRLLARLGVFAISAAVNAGLLWVLMFGEHRQIPEAEYLARNLRAHTLLADVPLHDVWAAQLKGGPEDLTMLDVREVLIDGFRSDRNTGFVVAATVRAVLGYLFGWDESQCRDIDSPSTHLLTDADRERSIAPPGDRFFTYTFEREALIEIINCTVHAFVVMALEPAGAGYTLYWAFYVKPVSGITSFYMALIQPFRISIIYPSIIEGIEENWKERWQDGPPKNAEGR